MFAEQRLSGCNPLVIRRVTEDSCKCIIFRDALIFFEGGLRSTISLIISITKFPIVINTPHAHFSRNRRVITQLSNSRYPISTSCNWIPSPFARQLRAL